MRLCGIAILRVSSFPEMVKHRFAGMQKYRNPGTRFYGPCARQFLAFGARWNRSILPMQCIGEMPVSKDQTVGYAF
jgi:hypothetical protein